MPYDLIACYPAGTPSVRASSGLCNGFTYPVTDPLTRRLGKEPLHTMIVLCNGAMVCASFVYFGLMFAFPVYLEGYGTSPPALQSTSVLSLAWGMMVCSVRSHSR